MEIIYHFKSTDFYPVPQVKIVFLKIKKREKPLVEKEDVQLYRDFIVYALNQWKPNLKNSLKRIFTYKQWKRLSENLRFDRLAKSSDLTFDQWLSLFNFFRRIEESKQTNLEIFG